MKEPILNPNELLKTRGKEYTPKKVIDITDIDSQLICRVFDYNDRAEEIATLIRQLLQEKY